MANDPDGWEDMLEELSSTTLPPAAATRPSARPPETTGVRTRTPELEAAVAATPAHVTDRPVAPPPVEDDSAGKQTAVMPALTQSMLVKLQKELADAARPPGSSDKTLPPGEQPPEDGVVRSQGVPGDSTDRSSEEKRPTIRGTGTPSAPRIGQPVDFRARTPAFGMTSDPSYRGPIVSEVREEPEEALDTVRPPRDEYGPTVREFRSNSERDELGRPDHQAPPPDDEHAEDHAVVIPYTDVPSPGLRALFPDELSHDEPLEPDVDRAVDTAFAQIVMDDAQALTKRTRWIEQGLWLLTWSLVWLFSLSQFTRRALLGVVALAPILLAAAIYHLADDWWYYNPF